MNMGAPSSAPRKPEVSHKKNISMVSIRKIIGREGNYEEEKTKDSAGKRRPEPLRSNSGSRKGGIELIPIPSDDSKDPLNWPKWKREMTFCTLLLSTSVVSMLKTAFVTTNGVIASQLSSSYMAAAALTGLPFLFAGLSSLGASVLSQVIGKRAIYISSGILMLVGAMWNMHVDSYATFMVSRLFQGIGWGATEGLAVVSIRDIYFVHERGLRMNIHTITSLVFTWGSPILAGYLSQSGDGYSQALMVISIIQAFSVFFLIFCLPETTFSRASANKGVSSQNSGPTPSVVKSYLAILHPFSHHASFSLAEALKPIRALGAPTTVLTLAATFPLLPTSHAFANSLSLLYGTAPTFLFPARLGFIFILPLVLSVTGYIFVVLISHFRSSLSSFPMSEVLPAILTGVLGIVSIGAYTINQLGPVELTNGITVFMDPTGESLSLIVVSALLGMTVAGSTMLSYSSSQHLSASSLSPPSISHMPLETGHKFWESAFTGIFIMAIPAWIELGGGGNIGLRDVTLALAIIQILLGSTAGAVMVMKKEVVERLDKRVIGVKQHIGVGGSEGLREWDIRDSYGGV